MALRAALAYKNRLVGMLWFAVFVNYAVRFTVPSVLHLIGDDFGVGLVRLGGLVSVFALTYGVFAPLAGRIVDRVGPRTTVIASIFTWSLMSIAVGLARTFPQMLLCWAAEGVAQTFYFPAAVTLISAYHDPSTRSRALAFHQTGLYAGLIGGSVFSAWIGGYFGWRSSFFLLGGAGLIVAACLQAGLRKPEDTAPSVTAGSFRGFLVVIAGNPVCICLSLAFVCANFGSTVLLGWMPKFIHDKFYLSLPISSFNATAFAQISCMLTAPIGGWAADRLVRNGKLQGRILVQSLGLLGGAPFIFLCGYSRSLMLLCVVLSLWGLFKGLYDPSIFASVFDEISPSYRGTAVGFMNMVGWALGGATGPLFIGYLAKKISLSAAISLTCVLYMIGGALLVLAAGFKGRSSSGRLG